MSLRQHSLDVLYPARTLPVYGHTCRLFYQVSAIYTARRYTHHRAVNGGFLTRRQTPLIETESPAVNSRHAAPYRYTPPRRAQRQITGAVSARFSQAARLGGR